MAVVDASVVVGFLSGERALLDERFRAEEHVLWAPHLIDAEVGHALRRQVHLGRIDAGAAGKAILEINDLPLRRVEHENLLRVAWDLRDNFSYYDALYVSLALVLGETLFTLDARMTRSGIDFPIEVLGQA